MIWIRINMQKDWIRLNTRSSHIQVTMKQGGEMPYALLPIKIRPEGLSPDSLYMIPLKLTGVSAYEINQRRTVCFIRLFWRMILHRKRTIH